MIRRIISINEEKCNGCGLCASACHEGAIGIVNGKAKLLKENHCDGLGDCLPACPLNAISFVEREAPAYDEKAVQETMREKQMKELSPCSLHTAAEHKPGRKLQFPIQLKLVSPNADFLQDADLLIAADCCAYCYGNFHRDFIQDKILLIGCPKLDAVDYSEKLTQIFSENNIRSVTVARMTVPCCGGLSYAVQKAIEASGKNLIPQIYMIHPNGAVE